jgi:catechol 2,3-dioxygenase-like lactoylglutathione lyase family enzyme
VPEASELADRRDVGLTHIALVITDVERSIAFYERYAGMRVVHRREDPDGSTVIWLSDLTRPFVLVLARGPRPGAALGPFAHLGVGCASREELTRRAEQARAEGCLRAGPTDSGYPVGYWAFLSDPDGHTLELSFGQEVALTVEAAKATESSSL